MRFRKLRIAWSVFCGIACVLLIVLWVRSYWWQHVVSWRYSTPHAIRVYTYPGRFSFESFDDRQEATGYEMSGGQISLYWGPVFKISSMQLTEPTAWHLYAGPIGNPVLIPFCAPVAAFAFVAVLPWLPPRFIVRFLLIATTLVALMLGLAFYAARR